MPILDIYSEARHSLREGHIAQQTFDWLNIFEKKKTKKYIERHFFYSFILFLL